MNLSGKKVALLGGTLISCEIVKTAQALGMEVHVLDYYPVEQSPAKQLVEHHAQISVLDDDAIVHYLKSKKIDGVITGYSDMLLPYYARICEKAQLPCYGTEKLFKLFTNKRAWKDLCLEYGVPTALKYNAYTVLDEDEVLFPLLVKPCDGSGSHGVSVVKDKSELKKAIDAARDVSKSGEVLVEQYLLGPEITVFWLFVNGRYYVTQVGNRIVKSFKNGVLPLPVGYTFPSAYMGSYMRDVAPKVRTMLASQDVKNGMMFMQCIEQDGCAQVYDIGYRLTGSLENYLTNAVAGFDAISMLLHFAVYGIMTDDSAIEERIAKAQIAPCYNVSLLMKPGTIDHFCGVDSLKGQPGVITAVKAHLEDETLPPEAEGELRQIALRVLGKVDCAEELETAMHHVRESVDILDSQGNSLMLSVEVNQCE